MPHTTLDQKRASSAYAAVKQIAGNQNDKVQGDYAGYARDLPIMLLKCGIGQTLAFLESKRGGEMDNAEHWITVHLTRWLGRRLNPVPAAMPYLEGLLIGDAKAWREATDEAVAYTTWLKRFADAMVDLPAPTAPEADADAN